MNIRRVHSLSVVFIAEFDVELSSKHERAVKQLKVATDHLVSVEENVSTEKLANWKQQEDEWLRKVVDMGKHKDLENVYEPPGRQVTLTQKQMLAHLNTRTDPNHSATPGLVEAIEQGISLQTQKLSLLAAIQDDYGTDSAHSELDDKRKQFAAKWKEWRDISDRYLSPLVDEAAKPKAKGKRKRDPEPEDDAQRTKSTAWFEVDAIQIDVPSSYDPAVRNHNIMAGAIEVEQKLRQSQANDALDDVRTHIITNEAFKIAKHNVSGQRANTRATNQIRQKQLAINRAADNIAAPTDYGNAGCPQLHNVFGATTNRASKEAPSWIWENFSFVEGQAAGGYEEFFEDDQMPSRPLARGSVAGRGGNAADLRFFLYFERDWLRKAEELDKGGDHGAAAYARKDVIFIHPDGIPTLFTAGQETQQIKMWDIRARAAVYELATGNNAVNTMAWDSRRSTLYAATECLNMDRLGRTFDYRKARIPKWAQMREDEDMEDEDDWAEHCWPKQAYHCENFFGYAFDAGEHRPLYGYTFKEDADMTKVPVYGHAYLDEEDMW
ncbi:hypothetical protein A0H81_14795 [Grifola frondosa]|uniref:Uncharacterized protein n=1 Tax=Grifola frondosa TaxID=5627 RepID=A0A1C7LMA5_GRIFR|nr:hypothetical protein A0H81_14795 [Grifola frondosa]